MIIVYITVIVQEFSAATRVNVRVVVSVSNVYVFNECWIYFSFCIFPTGTTRLIELKGWIVVVYVEAGRCAVFITCSVWQIFRAEQSQIGFTQCNKVHLLHSTDYHVETNERWKKPWNTRVNKNLNLLVHRDEPNKEAAAFTCLDL